MKTNSRLKRWFVNLLFAAFCVAIIGWTASLTLEVMAWVLPHNPYTRYFALALFDGGVLTWLFVYIAKARGTNQRGVSLVMTVLDFLGVAMLTIGAIYLSGQTLTQAPEWIAKGMINVTIATTLLNVAAAYYYHATEPEVVEEIQAQELEDTLNEEALEQARMQVERNAQALGAIMANRVTARLKYRLRLPMTEQEYSEWNNEIVDAEAYDPPALTSRPMDEPSFWDYLKSFFTKKQSRRQSDTTPLKNSTDLPEQNIPQQPEPSQNPEPSQEPPQA